MLSFRFTSRNKENNYMKLIKKCFEQNFFLKLALSSNFNTFLPNAPTIVSNLQTILNVFALGDVDKSSAK